MDSRVMLVFVLCLATCSFARMCPGCPWSLDMKDPAVVQRLTQTLATLKSVPQGTANEDVSFTSLKRATSQVVAGAKYTYDFLGKGLKTGRQYECHLVVWSKPWLHEDNVMEYSCVSAGSRAKRSLLGGVSEISVTEIENLDQMKNHIQELMEKESESKNVMGIFQIHRAFRQVVSGLITKLLIEFAPTNCPAGVPYAQDKCTFQEEGHKICMVEVWEQAWLNKMEVSLQRCSDLDRVVPSN